MEYSWSDFCRNVELLRKNREKVPIETLKTTYAKPYNELLQKIKMQTEMMLNDFLFGSLPVDPEWKSAGEQEAQSVLHIIDRSNEIVQKYVENGSAKEISRAIFRDYDPEKAIRIASDILYQEIYYEAYAQYWVRHCRMRLSDKKYWNDLIDMKWSDENGIWMSEDEKSFRGMLPPTMELIEKEMKENGYKKSNLQAEQSSASVS